MINKKIKLWRNNSNAYLETYILTNFLQYKPNTAKGAIIICPGGGYLITADKEAEPVALQFAAEGYHTFVLRYSVGKNAKWPQPLLDLGRAITIVRNSAKKWKIDKEKIVLCGFSAGAHLAASLGVLWNSSFLSKELEVENSLLKPKGLILCYPLFDIKDLEKKEDAKIMGLKKAMYEALFNSEEPPVEEINSLNPINFVDENTPPVFVWQTIEDKVVNISTTLRFVEKLIEKKVPCEIHIFENGGHGLSLCNQITAVNEDDINPQCEVWITLAKNWVKNLFEE